MKSNRSELTKLPTHIKAIGRNIVGDDAGDHFGFKIDHMFKILEKLDLCTESWSEYTANSHVFYLKIKDYLRRRKRSTRLPKRKKI